MRRLRRWRETILAIALATSFMSAGGCANHRVVAQTGDPAQVATNVSTHDQFLWGLLGEPTVYVEDCESHALHDVEVSTTFWQGLATVVTLGIWMPVTIEWRCATVQETTTVAPIPGGPGGEEDPDAPR